MENSLHRMLDGTFGEDDSLSRNRPPVGRIHFVFCGRRKLQRFGSQAALLRGARSGGVAWAYTVANSRAATNC